MTNIVLLGSNFLSATILSSLLGHDHTHVTVIDRRDPLVIRNQNQDVFRIIKNYCYLPNYTISYKDTFEATEFGDQKRDIILSFLFKDWVREDISSYLKNADIIVHSGSIYDTDVAKTSQLEVMEVNINGMFNIIKQLKSLDSEKKKLFLHMSSINVYGDQSEFQGEEITEDIVPNPKDLLNYTLYTQENMIKSLLNHDYMIFRLGTLTGYFTPATCLVTSSVIALLDRKHHPEYTVYNPDNSIELLDTKDLGMLINNVYSLYKEGNDKMVNQVYNIKAEESPPKNVRQIVEVIMTTPKRLPTITKEHGIKGISNFSLKPPKIVESLTDEDAFIKFPKPISIKKSREILNFLSMKPLVYSLITDTVSYVLTYLISDIPENQRIALKKMFYLHSTPTPETVDEMENASGADINKDVKSLVQDVTKGIEKAFDKEEAQAEAYEKAYEASGRSSRPDF